MFLIWFYYGNMTAGLYANTVYTGNSSKFNEVTFIFFLPSLEYGVL
ncbi:hypothetical protein GBAR_LOCUS22703 [Geodia barretti]|uniref:Uncharacterized protein n=1 Tax=Geodia barretti TaxID=519541 RepID=A0AA35T3K9_GEOBA|nr:hypothetical protein GBAR_LOCUS22703 [Geodia barretti]